jgi:hypothetical protein
MEKFGSGIRDEKNSDPGSRINIPDPQHYKDEKGRKLTTSARKIVRRAYKLS